MVGKNKELLMESELEHILMNAYKDQMMEYAQTHPECFDEAASLSLTTRRHLCWRAAWLLHSNALENDERLRPYVSKFIDAIPGKKDGHQRELLKLLQKMKLDEEQEGRLFDICVDMWEKIGNRPSVRYTAFMFMLSVVEKYPELKNEIEFFTQDHFLESLSPGIKAGLKQKVKDMHRNNFE